MKQKIHNKVTKMQSGLLIALGILAGASIATNLTALAWGPDRATFTIAQPASYVTFDSITNNPNYGDERNFTLVRAVGEANTQWRDSVTVTGDQEYDIRVYVHNNAASNLNLVATNTKVVASVPNETANSIKIQGQISADNANPVTIWDQVVFSGAQKFNIAYVAGSARYGNNAKEFSLPDSIVTSAGAQLGFQNLDGNIPGCYEYSGAVYFKVKVTVEKLPDPGFSVEKKVRKHGTTEWSKSINANPGDAVDYQIGYKNTGTAKQVNVYAKDKLPAGVKYTNDTTTVKNANNSTGDGLKIKSNAIIGAGINVGDYESNANAYVRFTATLPSKENLECGDNRLINVGTISTDNGAKDDTAEVVINVECKPGECKPGIPEGDERCETPPTPGELPKTGPAEAILAIIAVLAITIGVVYWYKSRVDMRKIALDTDDTNGAKTPAHHQTNHTAAHHTEHKK